MHLKSDEELYEEALILLRQRGYLKVSELMRQFRIDGTRAGMLFNRLDDAKAWSIFRW